MRLLVAWGNAISPSFPRHLDARPFSTAAIRKKMKESRNHPGRDQFALRAGFG
jgi:hypothetical protein